MAKIIVKRKKAPVVTPEVLQRSNEANSNFPNNPANGSSSSSGGSDKTLGAPGMKKIKKSVSTGFLPALDGGGDSQREREVADGVRSPVETASTTTRSCKRLDISML